MIYQILKIFFLTILLCGIYIGSLSLLEQEQKSIKNIAQNQVPPSYQQNVYFEKNIGQFSNKKVLYRATDAQATHFFLQNEIRSVIQGSGKNVTNYAYSIKFHNTSASTEITNHKKRDIRKGVQNYIKGKKNYKSIPIFSDLNYEHLWPGVNVSFYTQKNHMKYDFIVQPHADPDQIVFSIKGAKNIQVNEKGELEFTTAVGTLQKGKPYTYQLVDGKEKEIPCQYLIEGNHITFKLGSYDKTLPLIIDPIALKWATFLGGTQDENPSTIHATDDYIYSTGYTNSPDFPSTVGNGYQSESDVYVTCMEKDGSAIVWSTLIGGAGIDRGVGITVDEQGDVYVIGETRSSDFPINGQVTAYDNTANGNDDIFILRLSPDGTTLKYSTFIGSGGTEDVLMKTPVVVEEVLYLSAKAAVGFPTTSGALFSYSNSSNPVLFGIDTKVGGTSALVFSTYIANDNLYGYVTDMALSADQELLLTGVANDDLIISPNAIQKTGEFDVNGNQAPFLMKFSLTGQYLYSTWVNPLYVSGSYYGYFSGVKVDVDPQGDIYVGTVGAIDEPAAAILIHPSVQAFHELSPLALQQSISSSNWIEFMSLTKIPKDFNAGFEYVSVLPNVMNFNSNEPLFKIDIKGKIHIHSTASNMFGRNFYFPYTSGAISQSNSAGVDNGSNYYVLHPSGSTVLYGTTLIESGNLGTAFNGIAVDDDCKAYLQGIARVRNGFAITPTYRDRNTNSQISILQPNFNGVGDSYIAVFEDVLPDNTIEDFQAGNNTFCLNSLIYQNPNEGPVEGTISYTSGDGSSSTHNLPDIDWGYRIDNHPNPGTVSYQWQVSRNNGASWSNIDGAVLSVLKPESESTAGNVQYRRGVINGCCDTLFSNVATASIAGNFNLNIDAPIDPVYYCEGVSKPLNITISGASGNISWQWYYGFSPLTNSEISPASGSGTVASFSATIPTTMNDQGSLRLVVTDAGGCKKETSISLLKMFASAGTSTNLALCPDDLSNNVTLGPSAANPLFDYSWTGPSGFSSTEANPEVSVPGTYTLYVKLQTDATFCTSSASSVNVIAPTAHDPALTDISDIFFCQDDAPAAIGLSGNAPTGYVFQWSPGINLDNAQAFSPTYDPGILPYGETPIAELTYTFTALRLNDGCVFERMVTVSNTALANADAGDDVGNCGAIPINILGDDNTTGQYWQWQPISTTYPGGLPMLTSDPAFSLDGLNTTSGTNKFVAVTGPSLATCYEIAFELQASFVPFPNTCFSTDYTVLTICPTSSCNICPSLTTDLEGSGGLCGSGGGITSLITASADESLQLEWTTLSVDGVVQPAGTAPRGLFTNNNGTQGIAINPTGPHPAEIIVNFDDPAWGWAGANVVIYQLRAYGTINGTTTDCSTTYRVFSGQNAQNAIALIDNTINIIPSPGTEISGCNTTPYTITGIDHAQAPSNDFIWNWEEENGGTASIISGGNTPFPTLNPLTSTNYIVTAQDTVTGCLAIDTMTLSVNSLIANAGSDVNNLCEGSLYQLGTSSINNPNYTYSWSPSAGLNYPIGTPNSNVPQPYLIMPSASSGITYSVTVTDPISGCQVYDEVVLTTNTNPPTPMTARSYSYCAGNNIFVNAEFPQAGHTYQWSVFSGGGSLSWIQDPTSSRSYFNIPSGTATGTYVFQLTKTKGFCGSTTQNYTINIIDPPVLTLASSPPSCSTPYTAITSTLAGRWSPTEGLYQDANGTTPLASNTTTSIVYVAGTDVDKSYTITSNATKCYSTINVPASAPMEVDAGESIVGYCSDDGAITLGVPNTGVAHNWTPIGYSNGLTGTLSTPTAGEAAIMNSYLSSTSANTTFFNQSTRTPGVYAFQLTSTFSNGCIGTDDITIIVPDVSYDFAGAALQVCPGDDIVIGGADNPLGFTYQWSAVNPSTENYTIQNPTVANPTVSPMVPTTYRVLAIHALSGCVVEQMVTVDVSPNPAISDVDMAVQCHPISSVNLTAQIPSYGSYVNPIWYRNGVPGFVENTPSSVTPLQTTEYFLVAENSLGCPDTAMVIVNIDNPQTPSIPPIAYLGCSDLTIDLTDFEPLLSDPTFYFEWHFANNTSNSTLITDTNVEAGTYFLFEISPNGCESTSDQITVQRVSNCTEICGDGIDNDDDGLTDNADNDCCAAQAPTLSKQ